MPFEVRSWAMTRDMEIAYEVEFLEHDAEKAFEEAVLLRRQMELAGELAAQVLEHARPRLEKYCMGRPVSSALLDQVLACLKTTMVELDIVGWQPELKQISSPGRFQFGLTPIGGWSSESLLRTSEGTTISVGPPYCCFSIS